MALLPDSLGDFLLSMPSLRSLEKAFNPREIDWIVPDLLLEAAKIIRLDANRIPFSDLKNQTYHDADFIFSFPPAARYHWLAKQVGGKRRVGYVHEKMWIPRIVGRFSLTDRWVCPENSNLHELEAYGKLLEIVSLPFRPEFPQSTLSEPPKKNRIGIHLNSRWPKNPLPILKLIDSPIILAPKAFEETAQKWLSESGLSNPIFHGSLSFEAFANEIQSLNVLIAIDGGPVHLAAFLKVSSIVFYPEEQFDYRVMKWHPWGVPYHALPLSEKGFTQFPSALEKAFTKSARIS